MIRANAIAPSAPLNQRSRSQACGSPRGVRRLLARIQLPLVAACRHVPPADLGAGHLDHPNVADRALVDQAAGRDRRRRGTGVATRPTAAPRPTGTPRPSRRIPPRPGPSASRPGGACRRPRQGASARGVPPAARPARPHRRRRAPAAPRGTTPARRRSPPPAPRPVARRSRPPASSRSHDWRPTSAQVRPMNPDPTIPIRTVMPPLPPRCRRR